MNIFSPNWHFNHVPWVSSFQLSTWFNGGPFGIRPFVFSDLQLFFFSCTSIFSPYTFVHLKISILLASLFLLSFRMYNMKIWRRSYALSKIKKYIIPKYKYNIQNCIYSGIYNLKYKDKDYIKFEIQLLHFRLCIS